MASAVCHFHSGASSRLRIMDRLSISGGKFTKMSSAKKDKRRVKKADRQATEEKEVSASNQTEKSDV